jgi:hypothetical protein
MAYRIRLFRLTVPLRVLRAVQANRAASTFVEARETDEVATWHGDDRTTERNGDNPLIGSACWRQISLRK